MKWFKHYSDSYLNLKHQQVIARFGLKGYGLYWVCLELVAQQGEMQRIKSEKNWKMVLTHQVRGTEEELDPILEAFSSIGLIDKKALKIGDLYIPKLSEYSDDYTSKVRRVSGQGTDKVLLDKTREDKKRVEVYSDSDFQRFWVSFPRKVAKLEAWKAWVRLAPDEKLVRQILKSLDSYRQSKAWTDNEGRFVPYPATFLNGRRFDDELPKPQESDIDRRMRIEGAKVDEIIRQSDRLKGRGVTQKA